MTLNPYCAALGTRATALGMVAATTELYLTVAVTDPTLCAATTSQIYAVTQVNRLAVLLPLISLLLVYLLLQLLADLGQQAVEVPAGVLFLDVRTRR